MNTAKLKQLAFVVTDNTEENKKFNATLDGKLAVSATIKDRAFVYAFDEHARRVNTN